MSRRLGSSGEALLHLLARHAPELKVVDPRDLNVGHPGNDRTLDGAVASDLQSRSATIIPRAAQVARLRKRLVKGWSRIIRPVEQRGSP